MKNKFLVFLAILFLFGMVSSANALTLTFDAFNGYIGSVDPANENPSGEVILANYLIDEAAGTTGNLPSGEYYERSTYDTTMLDDLVVADYVKQDNGNTLFASTGFDYIFGKYGNTGYLWFVDGYVGNIILPGTGLNRNGLSHTSAFNKTPSVPEPSTMLLLGIGLVGIVGCSRKVKK